VKAAGGVRTQADALKLQALGCTRLGASSAEAIIGIDKEKGEGY
jgi:deoxyribose-phosphate aldolase